jgi:hypothetical protein
MLTSSMTSSEKPTDQSPEPGTLPSDHALRVILGGAAVVFGLAVTLISYDAAQGGGSYVVLWGLMAWGVVEASRGLWGMVKAWRAGAGGLFRGSLEDNAMSLIGVGIVLVLWIVILQTNRWHLTPSVMFLWIGAASLVIAARFLWEAGWATASEGDMSDDEFWQATGRREELELEKKMLLKAIKEIEFDHQMGKTSDEDARELSRYYRRRAIEVLKALESVGDEDDEVLTVAERIEREVRARIAVAAKTKTKAKADLAAKARREMGKKKHRPKHEHELMKQAVKEANKSEDSDDIEVAEPADADADAESEAEEDKA